MIREVEAGCRDVSGHGVLLIAHGRQEYLYEAVALARSIKLHSNDVIVALASDLVYEPIFLKNHIDIVVRHDFTRFSGVTSKLCMDVLSPFQGNTIFIDTDSLAFGDIREHLARPSLGFEAYGTEYATVKHWFDKDSLARALARTERIGCFVGGCYRFDRSSTATRCFELAREYFERYDELGFLRIKGALKNEEPLFSIAMSNVGLSCVSEEFAPVRNMTKPDLAIIGYTHGSTVASGCDWQKKPLMHFHSFRRTLKYECLRDEMLYRDHRGSFKLFMTSLLQFARRRINSVWHRLARVSGGY